MFLLDFETRTIFENSTDFAQLGFMKKTYILCVWRKSKYQILIIFVNLPMNQIIGAIFWARVEKICFPKIWRQIIVHFCVYWKLNQNLLSSQTMHALWKFSKRNLIPIRFYLSSSKEINFDWLTMELEFSNLNFAEISTFEYDAYMSWNIAEYEKWYQTKIWADRATLGLSNGSYSKSLSES